MAHSESGHRHAAPGVQSAAIQGNLFAQIQVRHGGTVDRNTDRLCPADVATSDLGAVNHQAPERGLILCLQLLGDGQPWRSDEQNPAAVALAQSPSASSKRGLHREIHGSRFSLAHAPILA